MPVNARRDIIEKSLFLQSLPEEVLDELLASATKKEYQRGDTMFLQGDPATHIFIVLEGWVKLFRISTNGNEAVVNVFSRGQSFGEAAALQSAIYPVSCDAVTDCVLASVPANKLINLIKERPEISLSVIASTFRHLHDLVGQLEQIKSHTGGQRIAQFLLDLAPVESGACVVSLPYDKTLIAGRLGMKPESLSRAFKKLSEVGVRIERNCASVEDLDRLRDYADTDPALAWQSA